MRRGGISNHIDRHYYQHDRAAFGDEDATLLRSISCAIGSSQLELTNEAKLLIFELHSVYSS